MSATTDSPADPLPADSNVSSPSINIINASDLASYNLTYPWNVDSTLGPPPSPECGWNTNYTVVYSCFAVVFLLFGILLTFFGYRFFKAIMFLIGLIFSSVLVYMIMEEEAIIPPEGNLGVAIGAGLLLGLFTMLIQEAGLFLTGFNVGVALVIVALVVVEQFIHPPTKWIPIGALLGVGVLFGILALQFQKGMSILGTSIIGAALVMAGVDYFVEFCRMALYLWDRILSLRSYDPCWFSWLMFGLWPLFALLGILIQWRFTSLGVDHRLALRSRKEQNVTVQQTRARQKRESQQTRYRHLYQARRVKGDVISQNFLHSIQDKLSPDMRSLTALNSEANNEEESTATTTLTQLT